MEQNEAIVDTIQQSAGKEIILLIYAEFNDSHSSWKNIACENIKKV